MRGAATQDALDRILGLQLVVAWAGEALTDPPRLGWWRTALCDELGGEDLLRRLTPRTWRWAVLEGARAAARRVDAEARAQAADADQLVSLYRMGFEVDEQLDDRLADLKRTTSDPVQALPEVGEISAPWSASRFATWAERMGRPSIAPSSIGRRIKGEPPADLVEVARALVGALAPLAETYPAPHFKTGAATARGGRA